MAGWNIPSLSGLEIAGIGTGYLNAQTAAQDQQMKMATQQATLEGLVLQNDEEKLKMAAMKTKAEQMAAYNAAVKKLDEGKDANGLTPQGSSVLKSVDSGVPLATPELHNGADALESSAKEYEAKAKLARQSSMGDVEEKNSKIAADLYEKAATIRQKGFDQEKQNLTELSALASSATDQASYRVFQQMVASKPELAKYGSGLQWKGDFYGDQQNLKALSRIALSAKDAMMMDAEKAKVAQETRTSKANETDAYARASEARERTKEIGAQTKKIDLESKKLETDEKGDLTQGALITAAYRKLFLNQNMPGYGNLATEKRIQIDNKTDELRKELGLSYAEAVMLPTEKKSQAKALDSMVKWGVGVKKSIDALDYNSELMVKLSEKFTETDIQSLNSRIKAGEKEFGNDDANRYAQQLSTIRAEFARLQSGPLSNAMLPESFMKDADDAISAGMTAGNWKETRAFFKQEGEVIKRSIDNGVGDLKDQLTDPESIRRRRDSQSGTAPSSTSSPASPAKSDSNDEPTRSNW